MSDRINHAVPIVERSDLVTRLPRDLQTLGAKVFMVNGCRIIVCEEPEGWHLSISRVDRDPSWDEIVTVRYRLLSPALTFAMFLPPLAEYVNCHPYTFHLHEDPPRDCSRILRVA